MDKRGQTLDLTQPNLLTYRDFVAMSAELLSFVCRCQGFPVPGRAEHVPSTVPGGGIDQKMEDGHPKRGTAVLHAADR